MSPDPVFRKIEGSTALTNDDGQTLRDLISKTTSFTAGEDIVSHGQSPNNSCVLLEGLACRYLTLANGQRQITSFQIAGDWIDLNSYFLSAMDHSIGALTPCKVALIPHAKLTEVFDARPRLVRALWRDSMIDSAIFREWVVNVGARNARERMAHLFCEMQARMQDVGLVSGTTFELPLTQADLADAVGISTVHANRTLQELRAENLIVFERRTMHFPDLERLREVGQFDPTYLHLRERRPLRRAFSDPEGSEPAVH